MKTLDPAVAGFVRRAHWSYDADRIVDEIAKLSASARCVLAEAMEQAEAGHDIEATTLAMYPRREVRS